jgi:hypothetical protein
MELEKLTGIRATEWHLSLESLKIRLKMLKIEVRLHGKNGENEKWKMKQEINLLLRSIRLLKKNLDIPVCQKEYEKEKE